MRVIVEFRNKGENEKGNGIGGQIYWPHNRQHRQLLCTNLLISGNRNEHLADKDNWAKALFFRLAGQMADDQGTSS